VGEVGNNHFDDFVWEGGCRWGRGWGRRRGRGWGKAGWASRFGPEGGLVGFNTEEAVDLGSASAPNGDNASNEVYPYHVAVGTEVRIIYVH